MRFGVAEVGVDGRAMIARHQASIDGGFCGAKFPGKRFRRFRFDGGGHGKSSGFGVSFRAVASALPIFAENIHACSLLSTIAKSLKTKHLRNGARRKTAEKSRVASRCATSTCENPRACLRDVIRCDITGYAA
jgi:hypothetical protein